MIFYIIVNQLVHRDVAKSFTVNT